MPLAGEPLLARMLERVAAALTPSEIIVATTVAAADDPIRELCARLGVRCYSGDPEDLLDRHYRAGLITGAEAVVKIPSDCPLIDPDVIDRVINAFLARTGHIDFVSNLHPPTYPDGEDVEIMTMAALEAAWREADRPMEREHTTPFIWERPERFRIENVTWETGLDYSMTHRWTIDYIEDYQFLAAVYDTLYSGSSLFGIGDLLALLEQLPEIMRINSHLAGINWYRNHLDELRTIPPSMTKSL
jgi:spore coat polysaccharide biosynthesis protein SpsF